MQAPDRGAERGVEHADHSPHVLDHRRYRRRGMAPHSLGIASSWTSILYIASMQYTAAVLLAYAKEVRDDGSIVEIVIWEVPRPLPPCSHRYKYRLYYGLSGECRVRYDNERGKGDHRHFGEQEGEYAFVSIEQLLDDFRSDVERWG